MRAAEDIKRRQQGISNINRVMTNIRNWSTGKATNASAKENKTKISFLQDVCLITNRLVFSNIYDSFHTDCTQWAWKATESVDLNIYTSLVFESFWGRMVFTSSSHKKLESFWKWVWFPSGIPGKFSNDTSQKDENHTSVVLIFVIAVNSDSSILSLQTDRTSPVFV